MIPQGDIDIAITQEYKMYCNNTITQDVINITIIQGVINTIKNSRSFISQ